METYNTLGSVYILSKGYVNIGKYRPERQNAMIVYLPICHSVFFPSLHFTLLLNYCLFCFGHSDFSLSPEKCLSDLIFLKEKKSPKAHMCSEVVVA